MNYYERHLGDYAKDTAHLSMIEHGAYTLLLDRYYSTEQGIPADQVHRLTRARSREERAAVDAVLAEFFILQDGVWLNGRAEELIAAFREDEPERQAKRENATERQRRARERRKQLFDALRERGIVPAWDAKTSELQSLLKGVTSHAGDAPVTPPVTRDNTATHTQTPDTKQIPSDADASAGKPAPPPAPKDVVFALGVPLLTAAGVKEANARSFLGMQVKAHGDAKTAEALQACASERPVEPISWLQARLGPIRTGAAKSGRHAGFDQLDYHDGVNADGHLA